MGINDLLRDNTRSEEELAEDIINVGKQCIGHNVKNVFISGIIISAKIETNRIYKINYKLRQKCEEYGFIFINKH